MLRSLSSTCAFTVLVGICSCVGAVSDLDAADPMDGAAFHRRWAASEELPFSFVYGGRPSSELIGKWKRTTEEKTIDATKIERTVTLNDPDTKLEIRALFTVYTDTPAVDWTLHFTNRGDKDTPIVEQLHAVDISVPLPKPEDNVVLHRLNGAPCQADDWLPFDQQLDAGKRIDFAATNGRSSNVSPFFNVQWNGGGVITAIGWSGQWTASVERGKAGGVRLQAGMQTMHLKLHPGEAIRSPRIMQLYWFGDDPWHGYNQFRRVMFAHVMPRIAGQLVLPPVTTNSPLATRGQDFGKYTASWTEADALQEIKDITGLGYEYYWVDAYYTRWNFGAGMGNYGLPLNEIVSDPVRWPRGLRPVSDAAHKAGLKFLVWFEPERVAPKTHIATHYPQYVISLGKNGSGLFNLGLPEAREYMTKFLSTAIDEWQMECLRIDYNIDPLGFWQFLDKQDADRVGMGEIRYMEGLYQMWDDLLKAHPNLFIDNCASGGRRIDLETSSRSIPLWRTDATIGPFLGFDYNQTSLQNQVITAGLNRYVPFSISGQIGAEPYHFRSGFNAGIVLDDRPEAKEGDLRKTAIAEGKRIRKYFFGDFYVLSPVTVSPKDWCVMQYHRPQEQNGMVMAFRRHGSPKAEFNAAIQQIDSGAEYEVTLSYTYQRSEPTRIKGADLKAMVLHVEQCPGSVLLEYRKK